MGNPIKDIIFKYQLNKCHAKYAEKEKQLTDPYKMWIKEIEVNNDRKGMTIIEIPFLNFIEMLRDKQRTCELPDKWFYIKSLSGKADMPVKKWHKFFAPESQVGLVYADEDMTDEEKGERYGAWFKPDQSPDTLLSFFYYGSLLFFHGKTVKCAMTDFVSAVSVEVCDEKQCLYDFILYYTEFLERKGMRVAHIPEVLFHGEGGVYQTENPERAEVVNVDAYWGYESRYDACKLAAMERAGKPGYMKEVIHRDIRYRVPIYTMEKYPKISIIIPSKDHAEILTRCIQSIVEVTDYTDYEIIVVDNGSSEDNRNRIENLKLKYGFQYCYIPMEFNFSCMCNLGVEKATGDFVLLLNDDMEIVQADWLKVMVGQASLDRIGAVGAKLLYPGSDFIQHVGISNLSIAGPAHQLLKQHDSEEDYYYGRNVLPYNVIGVTGACLMVEKKIYQQANGFYEGLPVSYNDVDFCFTLQDMGYDIVVRNDVVVLHHESLSRGDDKLSTEKWERLLREKEVLYSRHESLRGQDPYYNPNLTGIRPKYFCSYCYPYERNECYCPVKKRKEPLAPEWENNCLTINLEYVELEKKLNLQDTEDVYWIEGWAYVLGMDNSRYTRSVILINEKDEMWEVIPYERYRQDVVDILPEQINVGLSGFSCRIKAQDLPKGEYRVALLYKDMCSRQRLYKVCNKKLIV